MKRILFVALVALAMVSILVIPALADPEDNAAGMWKYAPTDVTTEVVSCNTFMFMTDEGTFSGTFEGSEIEDGIVTIYCNGKASYKGNLSFTGKVEDDKTGTMEMRIVGTSDDFSYWEGTWVILSGTGDLKDVHGQGTWEGPPGFLNYSGKIRTAPK